MRAATWATAPATSGGYFPVEPVDYYSYLRSRMVPTMIEAGLDVELQHHEVGTAGQAEIGITFGTLRQEAERIQLYKYIVTSPRAEARGEVNEDLIETYIDYKRTEEIGSLRLRPHPREFELYYGI